MARQCVWGSKGPHSNFVCKSWASLDHSIQLLREPSTIDLVPIDWRSANASASLALPWYFVLIACPICAPSEP